MKNKKTLFLIAACLIFITSLGFNAIIFINQYRSNLQVLAYQEGYQKAAIDLVYLVKKDGKAVINFPTKDGKTGNLTLEESKNLKVEGVKTP